MAEVSDTKYYERRNEKGDILVNNVDPVELILVVCKNCGFTTKLAKNHIESGEMYCTKCWSTALIPFDNDASAKPVSPDKATMVKAFTIIRDAYDKAINLMTTGG